MGPDHQVPLNCENLLHSFYRYIHSIFVVFLHVLFDKFTMPKTTYKMHFRIMLSKQIHLIFFTSCTNRYLGSITVGTLWITFYYVKLVPN